ncbi:MAG TPA: hypothetical protein VFF12_07935 [Myxococcaceae bacterium]|nr:hypothetical protein [Myxococcaceae bacterium]
MLDVVARQIPAQIAERSEPLVDLVVAEAFRGQSPQPEPQSHRDAQRDRHRASRSPARRAADQLDLAQWLCVGFLHHFKGLAQIRTSVKLRRQ